VQTDTSAYGIVTNGINDIVHPDINSNCIVTNDINGVAKLDSPKLLVWSAADEAGVPRIQKLWGSFFSDQVIDDKKLFLHNLAHNLSSRRTPLPWRTFAIARPSDDLTTLGARFGPTCQSRESPNLAIIFSGVCIVPPLAFILLLTLH
jgi:hypothetical protein